VLLGTCIFDVVNGFDIIILEFETHTLSFTEIARIPPSVMEDFKRKGEMHYDHLWFDFKGMRDLVIITYGCGNEVLVYILSENVWRWLPRWVPMNRYLDFPSIFAFEPRLDMKIK